MRGAAARWETQEGGGTFDCSLSILPSSSGNLWSRGGFVAVYQLLSFNLEVDLRNVIRELIINSLHSC